MNVVMPLLAPFFLQNKEGWDQILNSNTAGMATNAEDFTKQFMSQMFGKEPAAPAGNGLRLMSFRGST